MRTRIMEAIRQAGVVGAGGAGLPTHIKADASVDTVLVNGASCEPLLMSDPYLMEARMGDLMRGLDAMMVCTGASRGVICLKAKHAGALRAAQQAAQATEGRIEARTLDDFYPAGDEHVLVNEVLGRTVPEAGLPLHVGVVVSNVETLCNVAWALDGTPVTRRYVTVAGEVRTPMVLRVPVGATAADILAFAGGPTIDDYVIVDGGPMMGRVVPPDSPATKTTSGLLVLPPEHTVVARKIMDPERVRRITATICCQCTQCTDLCPRNLLGHALRPHKLMRAALCTGSGPVAQPGCDPEALQQAALEALLCSECGICEQFACPMGISPREVNAQLKAWLRSRGARWQTPETPPVNNPFRRDRHVPTARLLHRLDITRYDTHPGFAGDFIPPVVHIPLQQHIGAPATCVVNPGDVVRQGDCIGQGPEKGMGARVHASIDGRVTAVAQGRVTISA